MRVLLTGGSACGKSTYAEALAVTLPLPRYYVATMRPFDEECHARIQRHRAMRAEKQFETIERYTGVDEIEFPRRGTVLLECLCNLTSNEMFGEAGQLDRNAGQRVLAGVLALESRCDDLIVVTNDVASDGFGYTPEVLEYVRVLGEVNRALAARFDAVYELCCGIPLAVKGPAPERTLL